MNHDDGERRAASLMRAAVGEIAEAVSRMGAKAMRSFLAHDIGLEFPFARAGIARPPEGQGAVIKAMAVTPTILSQFELKLRAIGISPSTRSAIVQAESEGSRREGGGVT